MIHVGIDIGLTGAVAVIDHLGRARVADLEARDSQAGRRINGRALIQILREFVAADQVATVIVEDIRPRPSSSKGHGNTMHSQGSLMRSRGIVEAIVEDILRWPVVWVQPQSWKRRFGLIGQDKDAGRQVALKLFPGMAAELKRKLDHNRADALLLARYGVLLGDPDQRGASALGLHALEDGVSGAVRAGADGQEDPAGLAF